MNQLFLTDAITDSELWTSLKAGNEKAFSMLFKKYYATLVQYGNSLSGHSEKVQDCVQDVFSDIWLYKHSLSDTAVVKAYLLSSVRRRLARNNERDHIFRQSSTIDSVSFLYDYSVEHQLILDEDVLSKVLFINKLLNNLPPRQKEALYLRFHQGLSVEQVAEILNVNSQSASNLIHRALLHLRKESKCSLPINLLLSFIFSNYF